MENTKKNKYNKLKHLTWYSYVQVQVSSFDSLAHWQGQLPSAEKTVPHNLILYMHLLQKKKKN